MLAGKFTPKTHVFRTLWKHSQAPLISHTTSHSCLQMLAFSKFQNGFTRYTLTSCYSSITCEHKMTMASCNGNKNMPPNPGRPYQVVVAATRDMGIGKDGKLPWNLPSDLRYFKELTTTTSIAGNRNAVIMGRKTWESIPPKYRPLPGRLNVVLTRSGKLEAAESEDLVICSDLPLSLKLLAEPPHSLAVEKVFVIGGGQVLKEALNAHGCEAIHLTDIETNFDCDTFIPQIDSSLFHKWYSTGPVVENNIRFSFLTYVRARISAEQSSTLPSDIKFVTTKIPEVLCNELSHLKQVQEIIAGGHSKR